jgi:lipopolysaccharide/colanic/teichoic acid biosynthesis glycosyltransferase/glycosyltransferase involved in cell wall biosynthesis
VAGLRIAMIGQRGVPATFGGVERHVAEIGSRLAARGHDVTVYCRANYVKDGPRTHRGMTLRHLPTGDSKHLDAIVHSTLSSLAALGCGYDIVHYHALGPGLLTPVTKYLSHARVVQTIHGLDQHRRKWGVAARQVLRAAAWMSARVPDATIVVSRELGAYYRATYDRETTFIPNGVAPVDPPGDHIVRGRLGLVPGRYILFVGRLVPEKRPDLLLRAFKQLDSNARLVIVGGSSFSDRYVRSLHTLSAGDPRITMTGYVYGEALHQLYANAAAFVLPSAIEGMPLTVLEAASFGVPVIASDIPPHREILRTSGPGAHLFAASDERALGDALAAVLADPALERAGAAIVRERIVSTYSWDAAANALDDQYMRLCPGTRARRRSNTTRAVARAGGPREGARVSHRLDVRRAVKRAMDLVLGCALLVLAAPLIAACAIAVRIDSHGPIFFGQQRVGLRGRRFTLWKLRSMVVDAEARLEGLKHNNEAEGLLFKMRHDPRTTRVGRVLRTTSLDELPQLWNVIRGEMSLVGPRPPLVSEVEAYVGRIRRRLLVKPGMTGLWQISGRHQLSFEDYVRFDLLYVRQWSLGLDLSILCRTITAAMSRRGAY